MIWLKRAFMLAILASVGLAIFFAFQPTRAQVDVETLKPGPMQVDVRDEGRTRIRERYVVSTPINGRLRRIDLEVGDSVEAGKTIIARLEPTSPTPLDPRERAQAEARVKAAEGRLQRSIVEQARATAELRQAKSELARQQALHEKGAGTADGLERAQLRVQLGEEDLKAAGFAQEIAQYELELEQAAFLHATEINEPAEGDADNGLPEFQITSPISGRVLQVMEESAAVVMPGTALLELGDPTDLEVVVDVLSSDAVRIMPGQQALFEQWGGTSPLEGIVRLVEPAGFTKISALGVEEQRVNVVLDFTGSHSDRRELGDGYRVEARVIVWRGENVLSVPTGALFRDGESWAVYLVKNGKAELRRIMVGENNGFRTQVLEGLEPGDLIVEHPGDEIADGTPLTIRTP